MSFIGQSLSGGNGAGFQAGGQASGILNPTTVGQATTAYNSSQDALDQQQKFLAALQAQNGIGNQSSVYNQLQGVTNGTGPNPAQAELAQATGANVANQAALAAGQRGASSNVGLLERQAAQTGANAQQSAVGQAATLQANQSLNALNSEGNLATNQVGQQANAAGAYTGAAQGEQGLILGGIQGQNNANVGLQSNQNSVNGQIAQGNQKFQQGLIGGVIGGLGSALAKGGEVGVDGYAEGGPVVVAQPPAAVAQPTTPQVGAPQSNAAKFLKGASSSFASSNGPNDGSYMAGNNAGAGAGNFVMKALTSVLTKGSSASQAGSDALSDQDTVSPYGGDAQMQDAAPDLSGLAMAAMGGMMGMASGKKAVKAMVSPGERYLNPKQAKEVAEKGENPLKKGVKVPGKAKVKGNSYANDTVPAKLEKGGIVIPKSIMESQDPEGHAARFVQAVMARHGKRLG